MFDQDHHGVDLTCLNRPYVRLSQYELSEEASVLQWKLATSKRGGCQGEGCSNHDDLGTFRCADGFDQVV